MPAVRFRRLYRRTILALSIVGVLSLPSSILFYYRLNQEKLVSEELTRIRDKITAVDEVLTQLLNLESGVRGYASTGDRRFLDPYWEGKRRLPIALQQIESTNSTDGLRAKIDEVLQLSDELIQSPSITRLKQGKATMDEIRGILAALKEQHNKERDRLLIKREHREHRDLLLAIGTVIVLTTLLWLIYQSADDMRSIFNEAERATAEALAARLAEKKLSEAKSAIIQTISHEYRTPLTAIKTAAAILEVNPTSPKRELYFSQIKLGIRRLTQMTDDVLTLFELDSINTITKRQTIVLLPWFQSLVDSFEDGDRITLDIQVQQIECDETLFYKVFSNLISNALKYSSESVSVSVVSNSESIQFTIKDSGIGIPASVNLYGAFERGKNVGTIAGTGLGLSIVKKAVDLMGGEISVKSREGEGTEIVVVLPS